MLGGRVGDTAISHSTTTLEDLAAGEGLRRSAADRRDALVGRRLSRVGVVGSRRLKVTAGRHLLVEFEIDLLAIKQFLNDLVRRLLTAGLEQAIGLENLAAGVLVIWIGKYHAQGGGVGGRSALCGSWLLLARPGWNVLADAALRRVKLAAELVLTMSVAALAVITAFPLPYPILAKLSFEVGVVHPIGKATHELCGERLHAKVSIVKPTYIILAAKLVWAMREVARESFLTHVASEQSALLRLIDVRQKSQRL